MSRHRREMEQLVNQLGRALGAELADTTTGPPMGFVLLVFDFYDAPDPRFLAHVSNGRREDTIKLLREHADRLEAKLESTRGDA